MRSSGAGYLSKVCERNSDIPQMIFHFSVLIIVSMAFSMEKCTDVDINIGDIDRSRFGNVSSSFDW